MQERDGYTITIKLTAADFARLMKEDLVLSLPYNLAELTDQKVSPDLLRRAYDMGLSERQTARLLGSISYETVRKLWKQMGLDTKTYPTFRKRKVNKYGIPFATET